MQLVVDSNIIIAALIRHGDTARVVFSDNVSLVAPELLFEEVESHISRISEASGLGGQELAGLFSILRRVVDVLPSEKFSDFMKEANALAHDKDDTEFLAVGMALDIPVWSNDKALKLQNRVKVLNTAELMVELGLK